MATRHGDYTAATKHAVTAGLAHAGCKSVIQPTLQGLPASPTCRPGLQPSTVGFVCWLVAVLCCCRGTRFSRRRSEVLQVVACLARSVTSPAEIYNRYLVVQPLHRALERMTQVSGCFGLAKLLAIQLFQKEAICCYRYTHWNAACFQLACFVLDLVAGRRSNKLHED